MTLFRNRRDRDFIITDFYCNGIIIRSLYHYELGNN